MITNVLRRPSTQLVNSAPPGWSYYLGWNGVIIAAHPDCPPRWCFIGDARKPVEEWAAVLLEKEDNV